MTNTSVISNMTFSSNSEGLKANATGWDLSANGKKLIHIFAGKENSWKATKIKGLKSSSKGNRKSGYGLHLELENKVVDLGRFSNERATLDLLEALATNLDVRFEEHTGRSVEADEHGMNVIDQIKNFPNRWPIIEDSKIGFVKFTQVGRFVCFTIPSVVSGKALTIFIITLLMALSFGVPTTSTIAPKGVLNGWLVLLAPAIILIGIWYYGTMKKGWLEAKHEIRMSGSSITLIPKFLGLFPMSPRQWDVSDFRDLDVAKNGQLTFLFGNERVSCVMDELESEYVLGEVANRIESLNLISHEEE